MPNWFRIVKVCAGSRQLVLAVIDYQDNDLGDYREVGVSVFVMDERGQQRRTHSSPTSVGPEFTCEEAGRAIWGFPKSVEEIGWDRSGDSLTTTLRMDSLGLVFPPDRAGRRRRWAVLMPMVTYSTIGGVHRPTRSAGRHGLGVRPSGEVALKLGDHPLADAGVLRHASLARRSVAFDASFPASGWSPSSSATPSPPGRTAGTCRPA